MPCRRFAGRLRAICGVNAEMADETFGQALGELILQKRRALGLTQVQLAEEAYNTSAKTRRISELESGLVANPHLKTIDPIIVALKITTAEVEACAKRAGTRRDGDLDRAYREARNLIDAVARQFENAQPNASLAELDDFLRAKAKEWAALRDRIGEIDAADTVLIELKAEAAVALAEGRFDDVDTALATAEQRYQQERTLGEIRKHAALRITRGDNSLLRGDPEAALTFYQSAAAFFRPFDEVEMAELLQNLAHRIYDSAMRSLTPTFFVGAALLETVIELEHIKTNPRLLAEVCYRLSLIYRNDYQTSPRKSAPLLDKAISYSRSATAYNGTEGESFQVASMKINLANCLMDRAKLVSGDASDISEVISLLEATRLALRDDPTAQELRATACNSLGAALLSSRDLDARVDPEAALDLALDAFSESIEVSEEHFDAETWGVTKANIGGVLAEMADRKDLEGYQEHFLRIRAISDYHAAVETLPVAAFPFRAAEIHTSLAKVLVKHALAVGQPLSELYLFRAIQSYETVARVYTRQTHPMRWAQVNERIGSIFAQHAVLPGVESIEMDVAKASEYLQEAAATFEELEAHAEATSCREKIERVLTVMKPLP